MLYLIDSSIYIFRAWQTLPASIMNTYGEQSNATHGFSDTLTHILSEKKPEYIACAFDQSAHTGKRYTLFPDYKANREPAPCELKKQFERCMQVATAMGVCVFASTDVEADDIIGNLAQVAQRQHEPVTIVSADKDLVQFIRQDDVYWNLAKNQQLDYKQLSKQFKILPEQIADMLALCGDKVDNIPGIPGVGPATAARLLKKWQTLDGVIENNEAIASMQFRGAPRIAKLVAEHTNTIRLARRLTGLIEDDTLPKELSALRRKKSPESTIAAQLQLAGVGERRAAQLANKVV